MTLAQTSAPAVTLAWLPFALLTVASWGLYGVFLHTGQVAMSAAAGPRDPDARYKAFLFVGIAYFIVAVIAPLVMLAVFGNAESRWAFRTSGVTWSLLAGIVGAVGAFGVLLAFGAARSPSYIPLIMSIIFAGAPLVNAIVAMVKHPPEGSIPTKFYIGVGIALVGILTAAGGTFMTVYYKPS